jgi:hypothetical protein
MTRIWRFGLIGMTWVAAAHADPGLTPAEQRTLESDDAPPTPPRPQPVSWGAERYPPTENPLHWELAVAPAVLKLHDAHAPLVGLELAFGATKTYDYYRPGYIAIGDTWGASLRVAAYAATAPARDPASPRYTLSLGFDNINIVGSYERSRLRGPALLGFVLPELGVAFGGNDKSSAFARWRLPFGVLLTRSVALDVRPGAGIVYVTRDGEPDWFVGVAVGSMLRL